MLAASVTDTVISLTSLFIAAEREPRLGRLNAVVNRNISNENGFGVELLRPLPLRFGLILAFIAALVAIALVQAPVASAHRPATAREFGAIRSSVRNAVRDRGACVSRANVRISTRNQRWAVVFYINNCGSGSSANRFFFVRPTKTSDKFRLRYARGGRIGESIACAPSRVPSDIRCGARPSAARASRHSCGRVSGYRMWAYNLTCARARAYWHRTPSGWTGSNWDSVHGGMALLCRARDWRTVLDARRGEQMSLSALGKRPVILAAVPYESH